MARLRAGRAPSKDSTVNMNDELIQEQSGILLLTPQGYKALQEELEVLTQQKRPEIAVRIRESQEHGEFSEDNSELDEVKFEQALVENRIAELKGIFGNAQVLEEDMIPTDHVGIGSRVTVEDLQFGDEFSVTVVSSFEADPSRDLISNESPMGSALFGRQARDEIAFDAPDGRKKFRILAIAR